MFCQCCGGRSDLRLQLRRLHLIGLGEDDLIAHRRFVERPQHVEIGVLEAVAGIDQHIHPRQAGAPSQEHVDQFSPRRDLALWRRGVAVAWHVDQPKARSVGALEEDQFLGAAGRVRGPRQIVAAGQCVDEARFADIGAAGERDLHARHRRQRFNRRRSPEELPIAGEQLSPLLDHVSVDGDGHCTGSCVLLMVRRRFLRSVSNHEARGSSFEMRARARSSG